MRFLLDSCVSFRVADELNSSGHDAIHVATLGPDPGDEQVLAIAFEDQRVLVTLDKDFGELAVARGLRHRGIVRLVDLSLTVHGAVCRRIAEAYQADLFQGAILTVDDNRVRIRRGEQDF